MHRIRRRKMLRTASGKAQGIAVWRSSAYVTIDGEECSGIVGKEKLKQVGSYEGVMSAGGCEVRIRSRYSRKKARKIPINRAKTPAIIMLRKIFGLLFFSAGMARSSTCTVGVSRASTNLACSSWDVSRV